MVDMGLGRGSPCRALSGCALGPGMWGPSGTALLAWIPALVCCPASCGEMQTELPDGEVAGGSRQSWCCYFLNARHISASRLLQELLNSPFSYPCRHSPSCEMLCDSPPGLDLCPRQALQSGPRRQSLRVPQWCCCCCCSRAMRPSLPGLASPSSGMLTPEGGVCGQHLLGRGLHRLVWQVDPFPDGCLI